MGESSGTENQGQPISTIQAAEIPGCSPWSIPTPMAPGFPIPAPMYYQAGVGSPMPYTATQSSQMSNPAIQLMPIEVQQWFTQMFRQGLMAGLQQAILPTQTVANPLISHRSKRTTRQSLKQYAVPLDYSSVSSEEDQSDYSIEEGEIEDLSEEETPAI
ncbi:hypothetical protein E2320_007808 [Naja naja]|nr:hypothetical protein E2320_007808 [Naja naja]